MEAQLIVYPGFMMVLLTMILYIKNRLEVGKAFQNKEIKSSYLKIYQDIPPDYVEITRQTLKNQFELPILFYFLIALIYGRGNINQLDIVFAWIFVFSRYIHAYVRLSSNYVRNRAKIFIFGFLFLLVGWVNFLIN